MTKPLVEYALDKERNYTEQQLKCLKKYRTNGFDGKAAAKYAGYTDGSVASVLRSLKDEMIEIAEMEMVEAAPVAAKAMVDIMKSDKPIPQAKTKLEASKGVLDRVGLGKKDKLDVDHKVSGGIFIIPAKTEIEEKVINE